MITIRKRTVVKPNGIIEVSAEQVPPGTAVEVSVETIESGSTPHLRDLRGSGAGVYSSAEEVDKLIRCLRDEWDS